MMDELNDGPAARAAGGQARVLVLLRTHIDNPQVRRSIEIGSAGQGYDFAVLAHEEAGVNLDFGPVRKITHSMQSLRELGFEVENTYFLVHCADLLFALAQREAPGYDHYILLENDVFVRGAEPPYLDRLASRLVQADAPAVDLAITRLEESGAPWMWHEATARHYPRTLAGFFPFVVVSGRAIPHLYAERLKEQRIVQRDGIRLTSTGDPANLMFCEAFIGSALAAGGYSVLDLNAVVPGSYTWEVFHPGPAQAMSDQPEEGPPYLAHPVLTGELFLDKVFEYNWRAGTLDAFAARLEAGAWDLPVEVRDRYVAKAAEWKAGPPPG